MPKVAKRLPKLNSTLLFAVFLVVLLPYRVFANEIESKTTQIRNGNNIDLLVQKEIESFEKINVEAVLLGYPFREHIATLSEDDFQRDACHYYPKAISDNADFLAILKESKPAVYKKPLDWLGPIVGIYFRDASNKKHVILLDQNYPNQDRINGYFDNHFITANASIIDSLYRRVAEMPINADCEYFIKNYRKK